MKVKQVLIKLKVFMLCSILIIGNANPYGFSNDIFSQKTAHENNLRDKVTKGISSILKPNEYVVNVNITLDDEELSAIKRAKRKANLKNAEEEAKKELDQKKKEDKSLSADQDKADQDKKEEDKKKNPLVRNADSYNNGENSLFIDKFDFSAPLQIGPEKDDFNNSDKNGDRANRDRANREADALSTKAILGQISLSQDTPSVIDRIKNIDIEVIMDSSVSPLRQNMVKDLLNKINSPIANIIPKIVYTAINLIPPDEAKAQKEAEAAELEKAKAELEAAKAKNEEPAIIKLLKEFKIPLAIILFALLIGVLGFALLNRMIQFGNKFLSTMDEAFTKSPSQQAAELPQTGSGGEGVGISGNMSMSGGTISLDDDVPLVGFDRFMSLLKSAPNEALLLVRRWINQRGEGAVEGLTIIVKKSSTDDLLYIFDNLSVTERALWKKHLVTNMDRNNLRLGDTFIEAQIMEDIILPPPTIDKESKKILSRITPKECAEIIKDDFEIGSILLNVMPTDFIVDSYELLDQETSLLLSDYGLNYTDGLLNEKKEELAKILAKLDDKQRAQYAPFLDKLVDMIPYVGMEKERPLFDSLYTNGQIDILKEVALTNFPAELLNRLPEEVIRKNVMKYPRKQRVEFLLSLDEEEREFYLAVFGDSSSKMRSFIEADMAVVRENEALIKAIKNFKEKIGRAFIQFFRKELTSDETILPELNKLIEDWIDEKGTREEPTTKFDDDGGDMADAA